MRELMRRLYLWLPLLPDADNIDELGILRKQFSERIHVVAIPSLGKGIDDASDCGDFM